MKNSPKNNLYDYIEDIKIPIWVIDNEGRLISANKIFYYFFGSNEFGNLTIGQKLPDVFFKYINIKF